MYVEKVLCIGVQILRSPEVGVGFSRAGVTGGYEPLGVDARNSSSLKEPYTLSPMNHFSNSSSSGEVYFGSCFERILSILMAGSTYSYSILSRKPPIISGHIKQKKDGSEVKSTCCSCRGPGFGTMGARNQPESVSRGSRLSFELFRHFMYMVHIY